MKPTPWLVRLANTGFGMGMFWAGASPSPAIRVLFIACAVACTTYVTIRYRRLLSSLPPG